MRTAMIGLLLAATAAAPALAEGKGKGGGGGGGPKAERAHGGGNGGGGWKADRGDGGGWKAERGNAGGWTVARGGDGGRRAERRGAWFGEGGRDAFRDARIERAAPAVRFDRKAEKRIEKAWKREPKSERKFVRESVRAERRFARAAPALAAVPVIAYAAPVIVDRSPWRGYGDAPVYDDGWTPAYSYQAPITYARPYGGYADDGALGYTQPYGAVDGGGLLGGSGGGILGLLLPIVLQSVIGGDTGLGGGLGGLGGALGGLGGGLLGAGHADPGLTVLGGGDPYGYGLQPTGYEAMIGGPADPFTQQASLGDALLPALLGGGLF